METNFQLPKSCTNSLKAFLKFGVNWGTLAHPTKIRLIVSIIPQLDHGNQFSTSQVMYKQFKCIFKIWGKLGHFGPPHQNQANTFNNTPIRSWKPIFNFPSHVQTV